MEAVDNTALFKIGYGLYVITSFDGVRDDGMIGNVVMQVASEPIRIAVAINKANYSHQVIHETKIMNVNILAESAPFSLFQNFGYRSGRDNDKFIGVEFTRSANGLAVLSKDCNAYFSLKVEEYSDLGSHGLFICSITEAKNLVSAETMTYAYYQAKVKPKPVVSGKKKGYICPICGYVYEGDELPADFICPLCKHPASDFVRLEEYMAKNGGSLSVKTTAGKSTISTARAICSICSYVYDPAVGDPEHGIPAGTAFEDIPDDWVCPVCGVGKSQFTQEDRLATPGAAESYVCSICNYVYDPAVGDPEHGIPAGTPFKDLPENWVCPVCGASKKKFISQDKSKEVNMKKYVCEICSYVYDPSVGDPENGIPAGTAFEDLPEDWTCPTCGVGKDQFHPEE